MRTSFEIAARKTLQNDVSRLTAQKQLGLDQNKSLAVIDRSLEGVIAELRKLFADEFKARRLHNEITTADTSYAVVFPADDKRASSLKVAGEQLLSLIGADGKARGSKALINDFSLTQSQADDALGLVTPAVVDALKISLTDGSYTNDVAGLSAALKTTGASGAIASVTTATASSSAIAGTAATTSASNGSNVAATTVAAPAATTAATTATTTAAGATATPSATAAVSSGSTTAAPAATITTGAESIGTQSAHVAGSAAVAAPKPSWLMRFGLPFLLLGALLFGSVKYCSEASKSRVVAEERDELQVNLAGVEEQNEKTSSELASLQTNYDESQSNVESLQGDLHSVQTEFEGLTTEHEALKEEFVASQDEVELNTAEINLLREDLGASTTELEKLRDLPTEAVELQQQVIGTIQERDEALAAEALASENLKAVEASREQVIDRNESLKFDINTAQKSISSNAALLMGFRSQVDELTVERDTIDARLKETANSLQLERNSVDRLTNQVQDLEGRIGDMTATVEQLDAEIVTLTEQKKNLESGLQEAQASLDSERDGRQTDNNNFTTEAEDLQKQLAGLISQSDATEAALSERDNKIEQQAQVISELQQQAETLQAAQAEATDSNKLLGEQVAKLEQDYGEAQKLIDAQYSSLADRASEFEATSDTLSATQEEVKLLAQERDALAASIDELNLQSQSLASDRDNALSDIESKGIENTQLTGELQSLKTQSSEEIEELAQTNAELSEGLMEAMALNTNLQRNVDLLEGKNEELEEAGVAFKQSLSGAEQDLAILSVVSDKLQTEVAAKEAAVKAVEDETNNARAAIAEKLSAAGFEDIQVNSIDGNRAVAITLGSKILFRAGDVTMSRQGAKVLHEVGKAIADYPDWRIDVEGHTDSLPIGKRLSVFYPSNWELSSARASAVINRLRFASGLNAESMSARGFADTQPVAENDSVQGREKNRRVNIVLRR